MQISGQVEKIYANERQTKNGPKNAYDVLVNGVKCSYGFKEPPFNEGDQVTFMIEGKYKNIDWNSVQVGGQVTTSSAPTTGNDNFDKDRSIARQNALRHAGVLLSGAAKDNDPEAVANAAIGMARQFEAYIMMED